MLHNIYTVGSSVCIVVAHRHACDAMHAPEHICDAYRIFFLAPAAFFIHYASHLVVDRAYMSHTRCIALCTYVAVRIARAPPVCVIIIDRRTRTHRNQCASRAQHHYIDHAALNRI